MYSEAISEFAELLRSCQRDYEWYSDVQKQKDLERLDLEHELELAEKYQDRIRVVPKLHKVLKERREAKDVIAVTGPIVEFITTNKPVINQLELLLGKVRKIEKGLENRQYRPRVRNDLTICKGG